MFTTSVKTKSDYQKLPNWDNVKYPINAMIRTTYEYKVVVMFIAKCVGIIVESDNKFMHVGNVSTEWNMNNFIPCKAGTSATLTVTNE